MPPPHREACEPPSTSVAAPELVCWWFSQYIETRYATELLAQGAAGSATCSRTASPRRCVRLGPSNGWPPAGPPRPEVVTHCSAPAAVAPPRELSPREREVLGLMSEGRSNAAVAASLVISPRSVEKHIANIFMKLDLPPSDADHRRVLAVCATVVIGPGYVEPR